MMLGGMSSSSSSLESESMQTIFFFEGTVDEDEFGNEFTLEDDEVPNIDASLEGPVDVGTSRKFDMKGHRGFTGA